MKTVLAILLAIVSTFAILLVSMKCSGYAILFIRVCSIVLFFISLVVLFMTLFENRQ